MANLNQMDPIARKNRGYDLERSEAISESVRTMQVAAGAEFTRDGACVVGVNEGGFLVVKPSTGTAADKFIGIARTDTIGLPQKAEMETITVPAAGAGPFTAQLSFAPLAGTYLLEKASDGVDLVEGGGNDYILSGQIVTFTAAFQAANPGAKITVRYTRSVSASDIEVLGGQLSINIATGAKYGLIKVATMGRFLTLVYQTVKNYAPLDQLYTGAGGEFTSDAASTVKAGRVWKAPVSGDPFLGVDLTPEAFQ